MLMCNRLALGALAALMMLGPVEAGGDDPPPFASATEAYRQGASALKSGKTAAALPALEYAAKRGVLGAQVKLARAYASGRDVPKDDAKAFSYFQQIADQQADISPSSPIAKYAAEAFVALGQYYLDGIPAMSLAPNLSYAAHLFRHAASYFGSAEAQYRLARLYMNGDGVEKNVGLAVNWLATAAKAKPAEIMMMPASDEAPDAAASTASAASDAAPLSQKGAPPPASIGLSVGFGATSTEPGSNPKQQAR